MDLSIPRSVLLCAPSARPRVLYTVEAVYSQTQELFLV